MSVVITRLFETYEQAAAAVSELLADGVSPDDVSLVGRGGASGAEAQPGSSEVASGAATGATLGTVLGGGAGLLAGIGMVAIPGIGPVVAAGWLIATAVGAGVGAGAGGLLGALVGVGVQEDDANLYAEAVRRGGALVTVRTTEEHRAHVETILAQHAPVDPLTRAEAYRAEGWHRFDPAPADIAASSGVVPPSGIDPL